MPLNQSEQTQVAEAFLKCFDSDGFQCGWVLAFINAFTVGQTNLVQAVQTRALTWQPFIDSGTSIDPGYVQEVTRGFNAGMASQ